MVHSASITSRPSEVEQVYLSRHLVFVAVGLCAALLAALLPGRFWEKAAPWLFWASFSLLVLLLVPGIGTKINGAQRWFRRGSLSLPPSELMKVALPLFVCFLASRRQQSPSTGLTRTLGVAFPLLLCAPSVVVERALGTALFLASER